MLWVLIKKASPGTSNEYQHIFVEKYEHIYLDSLLIWRSGLVTNQCTKYTWVIHEDTIYKYMYKHISPAQNNRNTVKRTAKHQQRGIVCQTLMVVSEDILDCWHYKDFSGLRGKYVIQKMMRIVKEKKDVLQADWNIALAFSTGLYYSLQMGW